MNQFIYRNKFDSINIFRLYPVVIGNGRNLQSDAVIAGYQVPKGVSVSQMFIL